MKVVYMTVNGMGSYEYFLGQGGFAFFSTRDARRFCFFGRTGRRRRAKEASCDKSKHEALSRVGDISTWDVPARQNPKNDLHKSPKSGRFVGRHRAPRVSTFIFDLGRPKLIFLLVFSHVFSSLRRPPICFVHLGSHFLSTWDSFKTNNKVFDLVQTLSQVGNKNVLPTSPVAHRATLMYSATRSAARWYQCACPRALARHPRVCRQA